jgi:hypothetical protein
MSRACSTKWREEEHVQVIGGKARGKETTRKTKMKVGGQYLDLKEMEWGGVDWIGLAQDRNKWRALVNVVMNLLVP